MKSKGKVGQTPCQADGWYRAGMRSILQPALPPPEIARLHAKTNPHSPGRYRTIGVVSNMPEFATAFSCAPTAKMVTQPVCRVW